MLYSRNLIKIRSLFKNEDWLHPTTKIKLICFDNKLAFINLYDAQKLFALGAMVEGIHVAIKNMYAAPFIAEHMASELSPRQ